MLYCAADRYGLDDLKRLALRKQGLQSGIQCCTILASARYAYANTPDNDSKLRAHYLALIIRSRSTFKRSGTMQMEMEKGGMMYVFPFLLFASPSHQAAWYADILTSTGSSISSLPFATTWYVLFAPAPPESENPQPSDMSANPGRHGFHQIPPLHQVSTYASLKKKKAAYADRRPVGRDPHTPCAARSITRHTKSNNQSHHSPLQPASAHPPTHPPHQRIDTKRNSRQNPKLYSHLSFSLIFSSQRSLAILCIDLCFFSYFFSYITVGTEGKLGYPAFMV